MNRSTAIGGIHGDYIGINGIHCPNSSTSTSTVDPVNTLQYRLEVIECEVRFRYRFWRVCIGLSGNIGATLYGHIYIYGIHSSRVR